MFPNWRKNCHSCWYDAHSWYHHHQQQYYYHAQINDAFKKRNATCTPSSSKMHKCTTVHDLSLGRRSARSEHPLMHEYWMDDEVPGFPQQWEESTIYVFLNELRIFLQQQHLTKRREEVRTKPPSDTNVHNVSCLFITLRRFACLQMRFLLSSLFYPRSRLTGAQSTDVVEFYEFHYSYWVNSTFQNLRIHEKDISFWLKAQTICFSRANWC